MYTETLENTYVRFTTKFTPKSKKGTELELAQKKV